MKKTINWTEEKKEKAINLLTIYFEEHGTGESIIQNDEAILNAPELLAQIADDILIEGIGITWDGYGSF